MIWRLRALRKGNWIPEASLPWEAGPDTAEAPPSVRGVPLASSILPGAAPLWAAGSCTAGAGVETEAQLREAVGSLASAPQALRSSELSIASGETPQTARAHPAKAGPAGGGSGASGTLGEPGRDAGMIPVPLVPGLHIALHPSEQRPSPRSPFSHCCAPRTRAVPGTRRPLSTHALTGD